MCFAKNTGHFVNSATVTDLGCFRKRIFNRTGFSNNIFEKNTFLTIHLFFMLFSWQFHEASTMIGLNLFQTVHKCRICEHSL